MQALPISKNFVYNSKNKNIAKMLSVFLLAYLSKQTRCFIHNSKIIDRDPPQNIPVQKN